MSVSLFEGKKVLITAGPTYEPIDPVRFIGNRSSGKMGYAIAEELSKRGAEVLIISGPVSVNCTNSAIKVYYVETAEQMYQACIKHFPNCNLAVMAAAVADYTPEKPSPLKIKKSDDFLVIRLKKTKDILAALGQMKKNNQILVGFSLETDNEIENSQKKIKQKKCDMLVLNSLQDKGAGFGFDTNKITLIDSKGDVTDYPLKSKTEVAKDIANYIENRFFIK